MPDSKMFLLLRFLILLERTTARAGLALFCQGLNAVLRATGVSRLAKENVARSIPVQNAAADRHLDTLFSGGVFRSQQLVRYATAAAAEEATRPPPPPRSAVHRSAGGGRTDGRRDEGVACIFRCAYPAAEFPHSPSSSSEAYRS